MFERFGFGKKKQNLEEKKIDTLEVFVEPVEEVPRQPKTMEDVEKAKADLESLKAERFGKIKELRNKKDEIRGLGVSEFEDEFRPVKRTETFNDLITQTEQELAEISQKIGDIRNEFDFNPKYVEILEERRKRVVDYISYLGEKKAQNYRGLLKDIISSFGEDFSRVWPDGRNLEVFLDSLKSKREEFPEVSNFLDSIQGLSPYEHTEKIVQALKNFRQKVQESISEKSFYKTQGELDEVQKQINRGIRLDDEITKILTEAKNKEGRFENKKQPGVF